MEFSRQEYWSGFPFPSPGDLPDSGIKSTSPALGGEFFTTEPAGKPALQWYPLWKHIPCPQHTAYCSPGCTYISAPTNWAVRLPRVSNLFLSVFEINTKFNVLCKLMKHEHIHISEGFSFSLWKLGWILCEDSIKINCYKGNYSIKYKWENI